MLNNFKILIFDFDGVIKDSTKVKTDGYLHVFRSADKIIKRKILDHHKKNQGISRFLKMPKYAEWTGSKTNRENINKLLLQYSRYVRKKVVQAPFIKNVKN